MKRTTYLSAMTIILAAALSGCQSLREQNADAVAVLNPTQGNNVHGTVYFTRIAGGVRIDGEINGLKPGTHGFHIHDKGDCSAPDAMSAAGHYNPTGQPHGAPYSVQRHMGDFGNIEANASGVAKFS